MVVTRYMGFLGHYLIIDSRYLFQFYVFQYMYVYVNACAKYICMYIHCKSCGSGNQNIFEPIMRIYH